MLIAVLNDTHCGVRNSSDVFLDYFAKFYGEVFFPYCEKNGIKQILHLGDYYDHRKFINFKALNHNRKTFLEPMCELGMTMDIIPGNHDLPWINPENHAESMKFVETCNASILGGHLELNGFDMMKGVQSHGGIDPALFSRFEQVWSGHFHTKSKKGNIHYLGTQFEMTWADEGDWKYFHVFDTTTRELHEIRNPHEIYCKFIYNDARLDPDTIDVTDAKGKFVKVVVANKTDFFKFDRFIDRLQKQDPFELKIAESYDEFSGDRISSDAVDAITDTATLMDTYVDAVETELNKDTIKIKLRELYAEAQNLEAV